MKKRNQVNINLEEDEAKLINEYCRVHDRTPQWLFKVGARLLIEEDIREHAADLRTLHAFREVRQGLSKPIDDILEMLDEDEKSIGRSPKRRAVNDKKAV